MANSVTLFKKAAKQFGVRPETIGELVRKREIPYEQVGMAKALGEDSMSELASILSPPQPRRAISA